MQGLLTIYPGNHMVLELSGLTEVISGDAQTDATVTVTLKDLAGVDVVGQTWPAAMAHVSGSNGTYRATLSADLELTPSTRYVASIEATASGGQVGSWDAPVVARTRTS